jgi:hypothetical protein
MWACLGTRLVATEARTAPRACRVAPGTRLSSSERSGREPEGSLPIPRYIHRARRTQRVSPAVRVAPAAAELPLEDAHDPAGPSGSR